MEHCFQCRFSLSPGSDGAQGCFHDAVSCGTEVGTEACTMLLVRLALAKRPSHRPTMGRMSRGCHQIEPWLGAKVQVSAGHSTQHVAFSCWNWYCGHGIFTMLKHVGTIPSTLNCRNRPPIHDVLIWKKHDTSRTLTFRRCSSSWKPWKKKLMGCWWDEVEAHSCCSILLVSTSSTRWLHPTQASRRQLLYVCLKLWYTPEFGC